MFSTIWYNIVNFIDVINNHNNTIEFDENDTESEKAIVFVATYEFFPKETYESWNDCCICLENFILLDRILQFPCFHLFHYHCIMEWFKLHCNPKTCPNCRREYIDLKIEDIDNFLSKCS